MIDLKHLRTLCTAATPGPWGYRPGKLVCDDDGGAYTLIAESPCPHSPTKSARRAAWDNDARFIAAARTAIPELLDEIERLRQSLGNLLAVIHRDGGHYTAMHGREKAVRDAHLIWASLIGDNERLRAALKPFAEDVEAWDGYSVADYIVESCDGVDSNITVGDLLYAREELEKSK